MRQKKPRLKPVSPYEKGSTHRSPRRPLRWPTEGFQTASKSWQYQLPFENLVTAYRDQLPEQKPAIDEWSSSMSEKWGAELIIDSYVIHIGPMGAQPGIRIRNYDGTKYGSGFFNSRDSLQEVVAENLI